MARKYLDDTGLAALWAKIVSKINSIGDAFVTIVGNETITGDKDFEGDVTLSKTGNYGSKFLKIKSFYNKSDAPQAADKAVGINLLTRDNGILTNLSSSINGNGNTSTTLSNNGYDSNGNIVSAQDLILYSNRDGSHSVSVRHPEDWRTALGLATVASSGDYNDLSNKPTIPVGSDYVLKAGDTMTGDLRIDTTSSSYETSDGAGVSWKETDYGDKFEIRPCFAGTGDSNFLAIKTATGGQGTDPNTEDKIRIFPSGNLSILGQNVTVASPTSYIINQSKTIDLKQNNNGIPSGVLYPAFLISDSNGYTMSRFESAVSSDGSVSTYMYAHNANGTTDAGVAGIKVTRKKDSSTIWQVDGQKEFRTAINTTTVTLTRHSSAPSNTPLGALYRYGNVCILRMIFQFPNVTQNYYNLYNVTPKPVAQFANAMIVGSNPALITVLTDGVVRFNNSTSVPASNWIIGELVYLTAD